MTATLAPWAEERLQEIREEAERDGRPMPEGLELDLRMYLGSAEHFQQAMDQEMRPPKSFKIRDLIQWIQYLETTNPTISTWRQIVRRNIVTAAKKKWETT